MRLPAVLLTAVTALAVAPAAQAAGPPVSTGRDGAAATVDRLATQAAIGALRRGGNATDAAINAAAVLGVTEPFSCGIGGGGFMLSYDASSEQVTSMDQREQAPAAMPTDAFFENGAPLAFDDARFSGLSVGVPGTVLGWERALRANGTISLAEALAPAIRIARRGFVVDATLAGQIRQNLDRFDDIPATAAIYLDPDGTPRNIGTTLRNPDLARTYERIAKLGARGFYRGPVAQAIVRTVRSPPVGPASNHVYRPGVMDAADLRAYRAPDRQPTRTTYRGLDVYGMGPPSSGGTTVGEALNILAGYQLRTMPRADALHLELEASRLAFADRGAYLADSKFFSVPLRGLLSVQFAASRRALITDVAATSPVPPGDPAPFNAAATRSDTSTATAERDGSTTHLTVADDQGNAVAYTFTIESIGGSALTVPGYGFLLNNELTDFNFTSTTAANPVQGGKRPRSSMSPTIVLRGGRPFLAVGSPGGSTIISTVLGLLVNRIDLGDTLPEAIAAPRASQANSPTTSAEPAFINSAEGGALVARGHAFTSTAEIGAATGIEFLGGNRLLAAAEPVRRGRGSALTVRPAGCIGALC
jgi:gamma-glutamyltranspeptidase / glutathione hydrolase